MKTLSINLSTSYSIYIDHGLLATNLLKECCIKLNKRPIIITDSNLIHTLGKQLQDSLQKQGLPVECFAFPAGEAHKTRETKQLLEDQLLQKQYGRDTCIIALGGGVVTDLVGFLAATYCRGLPVIYVPTTLLAMVDASIGGKTGVNTPYGKNVVGTFTQPHAVFIDTNMLVTLPDNEWHNGMAEMIKHSLIADANMFTELQHHSEKMKQRHSDFLIEMIYANCLVKKNIVEQDEHEQGLRQLLNFGHTIGHAIETIENYHISHGEAVAIGMLVEAYLSIRYNYLQANTLSTLHKVLQDYGLPLQTSAFLYKQKIQKLLMIDKKTVKNVPRFVLLDKIGKPHQHQNTYSYPVDAAHLSQALDWAAAYFNNQSV